MQYDYKQGRPSLWGNDAFPPVSDSPISEKNSDTVENFHNFTFFSDWPQIWNLPPIFAVSIHFPPVSGKFIFYPTFPNFPTWFRTIYVFLHTLLCISFSPTFMHHTMHVLDASDYKYLVWTDDDKLLQESNLIAWQPCMAHFTLHI